MTLKKKTTKSLVITGLSYWVLGGPLACEALDSHSAFLFTMIDGPGRARAASPALEHHGGVEKIAAGSPGLMARLRGTLQKITPLWEATPEPKES